MLSARNVYWLFVIFICGVFLTSSWPSAAQGETTVTVDTEPGKPVLIEINRMAKLRSSEVIKRAHIVNPKIAEIIYSDTQSPNWVFVSGKAIGATQLTLWGDGNRMLGTFEVIVRPDVSGLKKQIHEIFPQEHVYVRDSGEFITLTGTISGAAKLKEILLLAEAYAPPTQGTPETPGTSTKIINLLQVGGVQQVMLEVRIAEISKKVGHKLGVNFSLEVENGFGLSMLDNLTAIPSEGWPGNPLQISTAVNAALGFISGEEIVTVAVDALQEDGLLKILAKPTLIAQSGQSASFLAGGEFPFPVSEDNDITIEWKPFGVGLNFTPTVLGDGRISLLVAPEVSELDFTRTISFGGFVVPSIETRRMSTVVELADNQSFAIAGLLKNFVRESVAEFPLLGDIPILGALFRSSKYQKDETELVVIVTPHLVKPVDGDALPLPTDSFLDPSAFELLLLGMLEGKGQKTPLTVAATAGEGTVPPALEGDFGHIIPE
jgi:pilus assembly protein CpaC